MPGYHQELQTEALVGRAVSPRTKRRRGTRAGVEGTVIMEGIGTGAAAKDTAARLPNRGRLQKTIAPQQDDQV